MVTRLWNFKVVDVITKKVRYFRKRENVSKYFERYESPNQLIIIDKNECKTRYYNSLVNKYGVRR